MASKDLRVVFHFNKAHNQDRTIPPWVVKFRGETYNVHNFQSDVGFTTKETPDNEHTKGSLMLRGIFRVFYMPDGTLHGHVYVPHAEDVLPPQSDDFFMKPNPNRLTVGFGS